MPLHEVLHLALAAEVHSEHPLAEAIVQYAAEALSLWEIGKQLAVGTACLRTRHACVCIILVRADDFLLSILACCTCSNVLSLSKTAQVVNYR